MATLFGETARFWLGVPKLLWNAATSKVYCYLYIHKGYLSMHVEVITRSVWCSVWWNLSDQQTRTNERKKSKNECMNEKCKLWKSVKANTRNAMSIKIYLPNVTYIYDIIFYIIIFCNNSIILEGTCICRWLFYNKIHRVKTVFL